MSFTHWQCLAMLGTPRLADLAWQISLGRGCLAKKLVLGMA